MIWLNAAAWAGLIAAVVPVLVHLLNRHRARVQAFPTLRFLDARPITPVRRTRLRDVPLMLLRIAVVVVAVAAWAQPLFGPRARTANQGSVIARAVIVDTSASMRRRTPAGPRALDTALRVAQRVGGGAAAHVIATTAAPATAIAGAGAWLASRAETHELVIVSDFQRGQIVRGDLDALPSDVTVRLVRIAVMGAGSREAVGHPAPRTAPLLLTGAGEESLAVAARDAALLSIARAAGDVPDTTHRAAIVYPNHARRTELLSALRTIGSEWMADVLVRVRRDTLLAGALPEGVDAGARFARAGAGTLDGRAALLFFPTAEPGSLASSALIAAIVRAEIPAAPASERDPAVISDDTLRAWARQAAPGDAHAPPSDSDESGARWLWLAVLALLGVEAWVRRDRTTPAIEVASARVA